MLATASERSNQWTKNQHTESTGGKMGVFVKPKVMSQLQRKCGCWRGGSERAPEPQHTDLLSPQLPLAWIISRTEHGEASRGLQVGAKD